MRHDEVVAAFDGAGAARVGGVVTGWEGTGVEIVVGSGGGVVDAGAEAGCRGGGGEGEAWGSGCHGVVEEAVDASGAVMVMVIVGVEEGRPLDSLGGRVLSVGCHHGCGG